MGAAVQSRHAAAIRLAHAEGSLACCTTADCQVMLFQDPPQDRGLILRLKACKLKVMQRVSLGNV